jgi:hypothetical protein
VARAAIGEIDDVALALSFDGRVRLVDETRHPLRQPVITTRLLAIAIHALLDDGPAPFIADDEAVQIKIETVLNGGAVDLGGQSAGLRQRVAIEADAIAKSHELAWRQTRVLAAAAANMQAEFTAQGLKAALERTEHARGDA